MSEGLWRPSDAAPKARPAEDKRILHIYRDAHGNLLRIESTGAAIPLTEYGTRQLAAPGQPGWEEHRHTVRVSMVVEEVRVYVDGEEMRP